MYASSISYIFFASLLVSLCPVPQLYLKMYRHNLKKKALLKEMVKGQTKSLTLCYFMLFVLTYFMYSLFGFGLACCVSYETLLYPENSTFGRLYQLSSILLDCYQKGILMLTLILFVPIFRFYFCKTIKSLMKYISVCLFIFSVKNALYLGIYFSFFPSVNIAFRLLEYLNLTESLLLCIFVRMLQLKIFKRMPKAYELQQMDAIALVYSKYFFVSQSITVLLATELIYKIFVICICSLGLSFLDVIMIESFVAYRMLCYIFQVYMFTVISKNEKNDVKDIFVNIEDHHFVKQNEIGYDFANDNTFAEKIGNAKHLFKRKHVQHNGHGDRSYR